jgi:hypothetical protein
LGDCIKVLERFDAIESDSRGETRGGDGYLADDMRDDVIDTGVCDDDRVESSTETGRLPYAC